MGKAIILSETGGGLYKIRPLYDTTKYDQELAKLQEQESAYAALLIKTINTLNLLKDDSAIAEAAYNAVIEQWKNDLISKANDTAPTLTPVPEDDPETGLPWVDPDRAQEAPLLDLINAYRAEHSLDPLARDSDLDGVCRVHLSNQAATGETGHIGYNDSTPAERVLYVGYSALSVEELLKYGTTSPGATLAGWKRTPSYVNTLLSADATAAGVAYKYAPKNPATHLWCVLIVQPDPDPPPVTTYTFPPDPAKKAGEEEQDKLNRIEAPHTDPDVPNGLQDVVKKYAEAKLKEQAAQKDYEKLLAEKIARVARITEITARKAALAALSIDCWCATYTLGLAVGKEVATMEVPGFYIDAYQQTSATIDAGTTSERVVVYNERSLNIAPAGSNFAPHGKLRLTDSISPPAVFYHLALEPGHYKWKPYCRYGIITALDKNSGTCSLTLNATECRKLQSEKDAFDLNSAATLTNVLIIYPPCNIAAFEIGDEVLVKFTGFDRTKPTVVGFRRLPRDCKKRFSWAQFV